MDSSHLSIRITTNSELLIPFLKNFSKYLYSLLNLPGLRQFTDIQIALQHGCKYKQTEFNRRDYNLVAFLKRVFPFIFSYAVVSVKKMVFVQIFLLTLHLLCVNLSSASPLVCILFERRMNRNSCSASHQMGRKLAIDSVMYLMLGGLLGVALGILQWIDVDSAFFQAIRFFWSRVWWGIWELVFFVACMVLYLWMWKKNMSVAYRMGHRLIAILAATNLIYHFPAFFTVISNFTPTNEMPEATSEFYRRAAFQIPVVVFAIHFTMASFAVTGLRVIQLSKRCSENDRDKNLQIRTGAIIALVATVLQFGVGFWLLAVSPQANVILGENWFATGIFVIAILLSFSLLNQLAFLAFGKIDQQHITYANMMMLSIVILMTGVLKLMS